MAEKRTGRNGKSTQLVPRTSGTKLALPDLPQLIATGNGAARFAYEEFVFGTIRNEHTRVAYIHAIRQFLSWSARRKLALHQIAPKDVGQYISEHDGAPATKKQHLAAIRHLFDVLVIRHAVILNPAASVRGERYQVIEGKTPELGVAQANQLLGSIKTDTVVGLRDRAVIATLVYTAARVGAVAKLKRGNFKYSGTQWTLRFTDKGGKSREIPVRYDLEQYVLAYLDTAGLRDAPPRSPLFRSTVRREKRLTDRPMSGQDMCRMFKRRLKDAELPEHFSPHGVRSTVATDLLDQGVPLEDVQYLLGHADPRTTGLYDRRAKRVTRNIVERISVGVRDESEPEEEQQLQVV
jgi:site-specific recombinase XerD